MGKNKYISSQLVCPFVVPIGKGKESKTNTAYHGSGISTVEIINLPVVTDDLVTVCVQHPGEHDDNSIDNPLSHWPEGGNGTARPSVVAVWKANGQIGV